MSSVFKLSFILIIVSCFFTMTGCKSVPQNYQKIISKMEKAGYEVEEESLYFEGQLHSLECWGPNNEVVTVDVFESKKKAKSAYEKHYKNNIYLSNDEIGYNGCIVYYGDPKAIKVLKK